MRLFALTLGLLLTAALAQAHHYGPGSQAGMGMMQPGQPWFRYGPGTVETLARAFLAGYRPDAELIEVRPPPMLYTATFRDGKTIRALVIDATTGEARLEP